jgi:hypothetical protein
MIIVFFIIAVVVSLPVAAIVLVSVASRREDRQFSLSGPADGRVQQTARRIVDFSTETSSLWPAPAGTDRPGATDAEASWAGRSRKRIDSPLLTTRMVNFRQAA